MRLDFSTMKIRSLGIMLLIILSSFVSFSQLDATFSSPDATQCPDNLFTLNATNTTYGNPNYTWLITGPGGYSQTPIGSSVAVYLTVSGPYTVKLTVTDGVTTTVNTQNSFIQVYNKPTISYSVTPTTGCSPLLVTFNGSCSPGSGTLASFAANAGGTSYSTEDFTHTFTSGGTFTPTVTVTNSFGCFTTGNLSTVTVTNSPSLTSPLNPNSICSGSTFNYTPTSTITPTTYSWTRTLPSGLTSAAPATGTGNISQVITNNTSGNLQATYAVTATANGCSRVQNVVVTVRALPTVSITQGATLAICTGQTGTLTAAGLPLGGTYTWSTGAATASINVTTAGSRSVTYSDGTCSSASASSTVSITTPPTISGFTRTESSGTANDGSICPGASAVISATVSATGGSYLWSTGATTSTITVNPPITSTYTLTYTTGCAATNSTQITVLGLPTPSYSLAVSNFCSPPITTTFTNTSTNSAGGPPTWSFQGGSPSSSSANNPSVTYNTSGNFSVTLTTTSAAGCTNTTVFPNAITIGSGAPPTSLFSATTPLTQCYSSIAAPANAVANNSVCFQYTGTGADTLQWNWGDGSTLEYTNQAGTFCHTYASSGNFTVVATPYTTVGSQLGCAGTSVSFAVVIKGPVASYSLSAIDCDNQRTRTFTSTSTGTTGAATYAWDFGDTGSGINNTSTLQTVAHTFTQTQSAAYSVKLTVTDGSTGCPASAITTSIFAYPNNTAAFQSYNNTSVSRVVTTEVCLNGSLSFYNETPSPQLATQAAHTVWNINNINPTWSTVTAVRGNPNTYSFLETGDISNFNVSWVPGIYTVSMRNRRDNPDVNNQCFEIETKTNYIRVHGITGTFTFADTVCANASMSVTDNSQATVTSIASRVWNWGDGTANTTGNVSNPTHTYTTAGTFTITLTATDGFGCTKTTTKQVIVRKPLASFSVDRNFICPGQTVAVTNNSTGLGLTTYAWAAPTATPATATGISPAPFTFPTAGSRSIKLTVTDNLGCVKDSTIAITVQNPVPSATASPSAVSCFNPPTNVTFTNTSTNNVDNTTAVWNFNSTNINGGTGTSPTTSTTWQPSVSYSLPGTYIVTLQVNSLTGCTSTVQQVATVTIGGPSGTVNVTNANLTGCSCYTANMTVTTANVTEARLFYDFGGQFLVLTPNSTQNVSYSYCNTGSSTISRTPSLYISNGTCNGFIPATQTINIKPTPTVTAIPNQLKCAGVNSDSVTFTGNVPGATYTWSRTNTNISASPLALSGTGDIPSFLTDNTLSTSVSSVFTVTPSFDGCTGSPINFTITVGPRPVSTVSSTSVCVGGTVTTTPNTGGTWTSSNGSAATITPSGIVSVASPATTQTTTLRYTETTSGCFRDHVLTVNPRPTVTASSSVCVGSTINLSPSTLGTWTSSSTPTATVVSTTGVVLGVAPGTVNFTYTLTATGCTNTTSNVTVNALPVVTLSPTTICQGQTAGATPTTGGTWAVVTGTGVSITNGGVITATTSATGPATFRFTQTSTGCQATTGNLTINALPTLTSPSSICMGSTGTLSPTTGVTWTSSNPAVATVTNAGVITPVSAGIVTFICFPTATGCSRTTSNVTINSLPTVTAPSSICVGSTATLSPTSGGTWTSSLDSRATVTNAGVATGVSAGNVTFTFTQTSTTCSRTTSTVTINALPTVTAASTSICIGGTTTLTPITGGTWVSAFPSIATVTNAGLVTGVSAGSSIMTFTNSTTACSRATSAITVNALPTFGLTKTDPTVCNATNGTVTLTGLTPSVSYRYTYVLNGVTTGPITATSSSSGQIVVSNLGAGTYTFSVQLVSSGCSSSSTQDISLNNPNAPDLNDIADQFLCGTTYTLPTITGTNLPGNQVYSSQPGGLGTVYPAATIISSTTTIYIWTRTPTTGGCSDQESFTVTISSNPTITAPSSLCVGATAQLSPSTNVTWTSSNSSRATVTNAGVLEGVASGSVTITVEDNTTQCSSSAVVSIIARPTVTAPTFVCVNGTANLTPATGGTWAVVAPGSAFASVTNGGVVNGTDPGTVQFIFTNTSTTCTNTTSVVTVRPQPVLTSPASVCFGSTGALSPTIGGTWTSLATTIATVGSTTGIITPATPANPGNVTFRFLETSSGCSDTTSAVLINALPVLGGPTQVCKGANISLTPSTGGTWTGGNSLVATISPSGVVTGEDVGTTSFIFTSTSTGCSNTSSTITVNPNPTVNGPSQVCVGSTVNYTGGTGFTWVSNNPAIATVAANGVVTGVSAGTTFFINTNPFTTCFANSQPITVNPLPTVTSPATVCVGGIVNLSPTTGGTWDSSDESKATVSSTGVVEGVAAGSVTFTFTDALTNCSRTTSSMTVIANPIITLSRTNPTVCNGTDGTIRINGLTANTSFNYSYNSTPTGLVGPITAITNPSGQITISGLGAGTYTVTVTNPVTTCTSAEVVITLTNPNSPNVTDIADQTLCGTTYTLPAITGSNLTNPGYFNGPGGTGGTPPAIISAIGVTTIYMYSATPGGCSDEESFTVTINTVPTASAPANVCQNDTVIATPSTGGTWAVVTGSQFVSVNNNGNVIGLLPGVATIRFTDGTTNCPSNTLTITVKAVQTVDAGPAQIVCSNSTVTLAGLRGGSATASVWSGGSNNFSSTSSLTPTYTLGSGDVGTVSLTLTAVDPTGICPDVSDQVIITIDQAPVVSAGLNQIICSNSTVTLGGTLGGVASNPTWSDGVSPLRFDNINSLNAVYTPAITSGFVTLTLTTSDPAGPCLAVSSTVSITINPLATVSAGTDFVSCSGSPIQLPGVFGGSATSATWSGGNGTYSPDANALTGTYMPTDQEFIDNNLTLTLTTNDPVGPCPAVDANVTITFANPAISTVSPDDTICEGESVNVTGGFSGAASSGSWLYVSENGSTQGVILPNVNAATINYQPSQTDINNGRVRLIYRTNDPAGPCGPVNDTVEITINRTPFLLNNNTAIGCTGDPINLQLIVGGNLTANFSWFANDNPNVSGETVGVDTTSLISDVLTLNPGITTNQIVLYTVTPTILASGCVGAPLQISLTVVPRPTISNVTDQLLCANTATQATNWQINVFGGIPTWDYLNYTVPSIGIGPNGNGQIPSFTAVNNSGVTQVACVKVVPLNQGCSGIADTMCFTVLPISTVTDPSDITICAGQTIPSIIFTGSDPATVYNWTNNNPNINLGASGIGNIPSFTPNNPVPNTETATITVTPSLNGCIGVAQTFTIVVKPTPILQPIANQTVCTGNTTSQVNFNALLSGATFTWTNVNSNPTQNLGLGANGVNFVPAFTALNNISQIIETHTITVIPTFDQCVGVPQTFVITVNPILRANPIPNISICEGLKLTPFTITGNVPGVVYNWTNNNIAINLPQSGTGGFPDATMQTGNFCTTANIVITPVLAGCQGVQTNFTITVCPKPNVYISQQSQGNCHAAPTIPVLFTGDVANTTYTWTNTNNVFIQDNSIYDSVFSDNGDLLSFDGQNTTTNPPTTQTAIYEVYPTSSDGCIGDTSEFTITVDPRPTVNSVPDQSVCPGQPTTQVVFTGNFGTATTYDWSYINTLGSTGIPVLGIDVLPSFTPVYSGSVPVVIPITSTPRFNTCIGTPTSFNLTVKPTPTVNQIADQSLCAGSLTADVLFTGNQNNNPSPSLTVYDWFNNNDQIGQPLSGSGNILSFPVSTLPNTVITSLFEVIPKLNGCIGDTMSFTIQSVSPFPIVDTIPSQSLCAGQSTNMICFTGGGNPITNYVWTNDNTSIGLAANGTTDPLLNHCIPSFTGTNSFITPQTATITVRPWYLGCQGNARTFTINVKPVPQVFVTPITQTLCSGDTTQTVQFTGTLTGTQYNWTNDNISIGLTSSSGNGDITPFPTSNLSDIVQTATIDCIPSLNGCIGDTGTAFIVVNPVSTVVLPSLNYAYCHGDIVPQNCFVGNNPNTTYLWTNTNTNIGLPSSGTGCVPSFTSTNTSLANDTAYIIIQPTLNGCPGIPDTFMIVTKPIPNVYSVPDINICAGVTVPTITFQGDMTSETDFVWSGNTNIGLNPNSGIDQIPTFVGVNTSQLILVDSILISPERQGCIGLEDTVLITVNPISTVTVNDITVCNGVTVPPLPINGTSPTAIYVWTNNNISIGLPATDTSFTSPHTLPSFTAIGGVVPQVAQIVVTPFVNGCSGINDTMTITVNPTPIVNPVPSQSLCAGTTSNPITFNGPVANTTFNWSHNNASTGLVPTSGVGNIPPFIGGPSLYPSPNNVASVSVTPVANGCSGIPISFSITVHPLPIINAGFDTTLCLGQFIIPQGSGNSIAGPQITYSWTATPSNTANTTPLNGQPYYPDATTTLSVIGTDANLCQNVDTLIVTYLQVAPPQVFAGLDTALCFGESITLTAVHDANSLVWDNNVLDGVEFTPDTTLSYIATASNVNGCYSKDTIVVTVNPLPIITANASDDFICDGDSTILWGSGAGLGAVYTWDNNVIDSVGFIPVTDTFTVIGTDINGCKDTADIDVIVNPNPVVLFSSNITFGGCLPFAPIFYDLSSPASASVTWDFGDGNISNQLDSAINIYDNYGCYDVTLTSTTPEGCSTSLLQQDFVCVNEIIADFNPDAIEQPISDPEFEFNNTSQNATSYEWFFGDGGTSLAVHPDHIYDEIGLYSVILVASAQDGCTDTAVIVIKVRDEVIIYVPNTFTPDDNGLNDIFLPALTAGYDRTEGWQFNIYNRWGHEIFSSQTIGDGWDGTYQGQPVQMGTYTWTLRFKDSQNNKIHDFNGRVTLLR